MPRVSEELKEAKKTIKTKEKEKKTLSKTVKKQESKFEKIKSKLAKDAAKHRADAEKIRARAKAFHEKADAVQAKKMAKYYAMLDHAKHLDMLAHAKERASKSRKIEDLETHTREIDEHMKRISEVKESMKRKKADEPKIEEVKEEKVEIVIPEMKSKKPKEFPVKALEGLRAVEAETKERNARRKGEAKEREMMAAEDKKPARLVKGSEEAREYMRSIREKKGIKPAPPKKEREADTSKRVKIPKDVAEFKEGLKGKHSKDAVQHAIELTNGREVSQTQTSSGIKDAESALKRAEKVSKDGDTAEMREDAKRSVSTLKKNIEAMKAILDFIEHA